VAWTKTFIRSQSMFKVAFLFIKGGDAIPHFFIVILTCIKVSIFVFYRCALCVHARKVTQSSRHHRRQIVLIFEKQGSAHQMLKMQLGQAFRLLCINALVFLIIMCQVLKSNTVRFVKYQNFHVAILIVLSRLNSRFIHKSFIALVLFSSFFP